MTVLSRHFKWGLYDDEEDGIVSSRAPGSLSQFGLYKECKDYRLPSARRAVNKELPPRNFFPDGGVLVCRPNKGGTFDCSVMGKATLRATQPQRLRSIRRRAKR